MAAVRACWPSPPSKLGARAAYAYDIDPQALTATRDNSVANEVDAQVHVVERDADLPKGADILLANILCGPLCDLAPRFAELHRAGRQDRARGSARHPGRRGDTRARAVV